MIEQARSRTIRHLLISDASDEALEAATGLTLQEIIGLRAEHAVEAIRWAAGKTPAHRAVVARSRPRPARGAAVDDEG